MKPRNRAVLGLTLTVMTAMGTLASRPSQASYNRAVTWADMSSLDLRKIFKSDYGSNENLYEPLVDSSSYDIALNDADSLISADFHVPPSMRSHVQFWLRIYTEYTTHHQVIFDQRHPEIVYEALDYRDLSKTARNRVVYEILVKRRSKKAIAAYRAALLSLARNPKPRNPTREQKIVMERLSTFKHKHSYAELARNLRIQTGQRDNIVKGLLAAETYFPRIEQLFREVGVPVELTRLSLVESSFNLNSVSRVGAAGVWQFMPKSAHEFMLIDDTHRIDERLSPLKSSVAAAKLLKRGYNLFGNWPSAVTSYNHGLRGLPRKGHADSKPERVVRYFDLCSKKSPLGWASRNYYAEFLAIVHAEAYRKLFYGQPPIQELRPTAFTKLTASVSGLELAKQQGLTPQEFKMLNPDVRDLHRKLPVGFVIASPANDDSMVALVKNPKPLRAKKNAKVARR